MFSEIFPMLKSYVNVIDYTRTRFFRALLSLYAHFFRVPICAICQNDPFWLFWFLCAHCQGLIFFQFADWQKMNISFCALKKGTHKFASWEPSTIFMRAMGSDVFSLLVHLLHVAWSVSEQGFNCITMCALGLPTRVSLPGFCAHCNFSK